MHIFLSQMKAPSNFSMSHEMKSGALETGLCVNGGRVLELFVLPNRGTSSASHRQLVTPIMN
jgi:hypothetical protein